MKNIKKRITILSTILLMFFSVAGCSEAGDNAVGIKSDLPQGIEQVTFVELGSVNCIPCKKMKPIMEEVEKDYAGRVKVVFHDVWTDKGKEYGRAYNIRMIPTQVFLDKGGNEIYRNEGFLSKEAIDKVLEGAGVTK